MNPVDAALLATLSARDLAILDDLEQLRLLTSRSIQQLHFPVAPGAHATMTGATRAAMRVLNRLKSERLISHLARRVGGARRGSQGFIWQLTSLGDRIQRARRGEKGRRRYTEPSTQFVDHTLAVTDLVTTLRVLDRQRQVELLKVETEPSCWREFTGPHGTVLTLKPDLYAVTAAGAWEDSWFVEADRSTEHLPVILAKCRLYARYAATGIEQQSAGVFPIVLWVVPDKAREAQIIRAIRSDHSLPDDLFRVVTTEQFAAHFTTTNP